MITGVEREGLNEDVETFFGIEDEKFQVVFKFTSLSSSNGVDVDELRTCSWYTTMVTRIAVYDCGTSDDADDNYMANNCDPIPKKDYESVPCSHGSHQTKWLGRLESDRPYFAAVSGRQVEDIRPRFSIAHFRRRIQRQSRARYV